MNAQKEQHPLAPNLGIEGCTIVTTFTTIIVPRKIAGGYFYLLSKFCQIRRKGSVAETSQRVVSLHPLMINKQSNHEYIVTNANNFMSRRRQWQNCFASW
jgi:hypothetical protein